MNSSFVATYFSGAPIAGKSFVFTSVNSTGPSVTGSLIGVGDPVIITSSLSGVISASLIPTTYIVELLNPEPATTFYIDSTGSVISASQITGSSCLVDFDLRELDLDPFAIRKVKITPQRTYPAYHSGSLVMLAASSSKTDTTGEWQVNIIPGNYLVECFGKVTTPFYINVNGQMSSSSAADLIVVKPAKGIKIKLNDTDNSFVLTVSASDARYSLQTGSTYPFTASWATTSSWAVNARTASLAKTASLLSNNDESSIRIHEPDGDIIVRTDAFDSFTFGDVGGTQNTSHLIMQGSGFVSTTQGVSLIGTSSWSEKTISASYAPSAGGSTLETGSTYPFTASWAQSSSFAKTASWVNTKGLVTTASNSQNVQDEWAIITPAGAGIQLGSGTNVYLDGNVTLLSGQLVGTASWAQKAVSASYAPSAGGSTLSTGSTYPFTSSWANNVVSASYAATVPPDLTVTTLTVTNTEQQGTGTAGAEGAHAEGSSTLALEAYSHAEGVSTIALGYGSHTEGNNTQASGIGAHAEGEGSLAPGTYCHAEGYYTVADATHAHAEGKSTVVNAGAEYSHAEGDNTFTYGSASHAEGRLTEAVGPCSHAEGQETETLGVCSHAEGLGTITSASYQHVSGKYNAKSSNTNDLFIIGNGTNEATRSNVVVVTTSSLVINGTISGSRVTSSLYGTASWANNAVSASYAPAMSFIFSGSTASDWDRIIVKQTNQTVTNNSTPQDDTELFTTVDAHSTYLVELLLKYSGNNTTGDYRWHMGHPAPYALVGTILGVNASLAVVFSSPSPSSPSQWPGTDHVFGVTGTESDILLGNIRFMISTGPDTGSLQYRFANSAAAAGRNSTTYSGSCLRIKKLTNGYTGMPESASYASTASWSTNTVSASYAVTASQALSASYAPGGGSSLSTGSTYPFTASWATNAISASWSPTMTIITGSTISDWDRIIVKSTNQTVTNSSTLTNDTELFTTIDANSFYYVEFILIESGNDSSGDYKGVFSTPALPFGTSVGYRSYFNNAGSSIFDMFFNHTASMPSVPMAMFGDPANTPVSAFMAYTLRTTEASGSLQWQFANNAAGVGRTSTTYSGSTLRVKKLVPSYNGVPATASYAHTASYAVNAGGSTLATGSLYPFTSSWATNAVTSSLTTGNLGTASGSIILDFNTAQMQMLTINGNITCSTANRALGKFLSVKINPSGSTRGLTFSGSWQWLGTNYNTSGVNLTGSQQAVLSLTAYGPAETDIFATYAATT